MSKIIQKQSDNSKYNRINQIYSMLKNNSHGLTITELANELNVSTKTIQRDLYEVLSDLGAIKEGRTWKIDPKLENDDLNSNERLILGILDEMAKSAGNVFYSKAHSLLSQITQQLEHPIFTNVNAEYLEDKSIALFEQIEKAIKEKNEIKFDYENYNFHVKPLKLAFFDGFWYLLALHVKKNKEEFKKYHLKTIKKVEVLNIKFEIPSLVEERLKFANSVWFNLDEQYSVRLLLDKQIRKYFERKPLRGQSIIGEERDGSIEIEIKISSNMEIIPLILYYIPYIKVLEPQHLADEIKDKVQGYLKDIS
ncbi:transcriptional regulator (plasmid) [Arcobacter cryaerophilus gv. pseudocryaerophilus]|uniref:Transcriptional regulator n=3 Tax=Arcobacteraceae TaxID=2808963 RepID=A0AA96DVV9_9BACT|nr:transcriptional regulator [Arcobacter sp. AZ-2023]WNL37322.1 transcriptional regulator [Arcobacter sp. AZ-2023]WPD13037.1 transcriptional regulator [Arcobacter sp. DSM 115960]